MEMPIGTKTPMDAIASPYNAQPEGIAGADAKINADIKIKYRHAPPTNLPRIA